MLFSKFLSNNVFFMLYFKKEIKIQRGKYVVFF